VVEAPAIKIVPRPIEGEVAAMVDRVSSYHVICVTSANGARLLFAALHARGLDARALAGATVAAIGPGTVDELARHGVRADVVPSRSIAEALVAALEHVDVAGRRVLVARPGQARDVIPSELRERGAQVDVLALYDTVAEELDAATLNAVADADYVTFTSSSTVRFFLGAIGAAGRHPDRARIVSIGPITSAACRDQSLEVHVEASQHDLDGLIEALLADAREREPLEAP
jgi:uroporphyrinogen III methyltransferase/synthase